MKTIGIYKLTSPSGKVYIGQSWNVERRKYIYSVGHCKAQRHLYNSLMKYGFERHRFEVIRKFTQDVEQSTLDYYEQFYMDMHTGQGVVLLNLRGGGSTGKLSEETKERIRIANTGFNPTDATRRKLSEWQTGRSRPHIAESNKRRAAAGTLFFQNRIPPTGSDHPLYGKKHKPESLAKMSAAHKGHTRATEASRAIVSQKVRGEGNAAAILTEAMALEIISRYKPFVALAKDLALEFGVSTATVRRLLSGRTWKHLPRPAAPEIRVRPKGFTISDERKAQMKRRSRGETNYSAKLTEAKVREIRSKHTPFRYTARMLAGDYKVSIATIKAVLSGRNWGHVESEAA